LRGRPARRARKPHERTRRAGRPGRDRVEEIALNRKRLAAESEGMGEFAECPYDRTAIASETQPTGSTLLWCPVCGAAWEWYRTWLRRLQEPDREVVRIVRAGGRPALPVVRRAPSPNASGAMWQKI
jgi:hypothetical protein